MTIRTAWQTLLISVSALFAIPSGAAPIIDAAAVKVAQARGAIVWDVRATPLYRKGHIPGAVSIGDAGNVLRNPVTEDFIETAQVEKILGNAGIDPAREVVVYAERGNPYAYFGRFALQYFGAQKVSVFHDGIEGWQEAGNAVETADAQRPAVALKLTPRPELIASTEDVVTRAKAGAVQIIDARTSGEYLGNDVRAIRGGHIPGAVNIPYEQNWKDPETNAKMSRRQVPDNKGAGLASSDALKSLYARLDPDKETVVYCQSGVRAAETAAVLETLGFNKVKVYDSSWLGYAARLDAPAERETFFNVGAMNGKLASMQRKIDELERMIGELHSSHTAKAACPAGKVC
ncbi:MAG: sulfurtransferase [Sulfuritalea sp.]|jgi:thiosulfate/3-mercaptopyruvate sulfurtransferase|nr:sulfurtransferase [Sulfuritalea sp.]MBP8897562.1 sulfurtransferase [Sulfuritalea sp.]